MSYHIHTLSPSSIVYPAYLSRPTNHHHHASSRVPVASIPLNELLDRLVRRFVVAVSTCASSSLSMILFHIRVRARPKSLILFFICDSHRTNICTLFVPYILYHIQQLLYSRILLYQFSIPAFSFLSSRAFRSTISLLEYNEPRVIIVIFIFLQEGFSLTAIDTYIM